MKLKDLKPGMHLKTSRGDVVKIDSIQYGRINVSNSDYYAWYCADTGKVLSITGHYGSEYLSEVLIPQKLEIEDDD